MEAFQSNACSIKNCPAARYGIYLDNILIFWSESQFQLDFLRRAGQRLPFVFHGSANAYESIAAVSVRAETLSERL